VNQSHRTAPPLVIIANSSTTPHTRAHSYIEQKEILVRVRVNSGTHTGAATKLKLINISFNAICEIIERYTERERERETDPPQQLPLSPAACVRCVCVCVRERVSETCACEVQQQQQQQQSHKQQQQQRWQNNFG